MTAGAVRVLIADDQDLLRTGTAMVLNAAAEITVVGEAATGSDAVRRAVALRPDVVLMDIRMPGMNGIEATRQIVESAPECRVLMLTTFDLDEYAFGALSAGASGFILKECAARELVEGVLTVASGNSIIAPRATRRLIETTRGLLPVQSEPAGAPLAPLSRREQEIFAAVARGMSNAEIASEMFITEATVKSHVASILRKLNLRDRVHVVIFAFRNNLVGSQIDDR